MRSPCGEEGGGASGRIPLLRLLRVEFQSLPPPPPPLFRWKTGERQTEGGLLTVAERRSLRGRWSYPPSCQQREQSRPPRGGFCVFPPNFFSSPLFGESWRSAGTRRKERRKRRPISFPGSASSSLLLCPSIATASQGGPLLDMASDPSRGGGAGGGGGGGSGSPVPGAGGYGDSYDYLFKFLVIGSAGTGKSCLLHQFIEGRFKDDSSHTIGVEFGSKIVPVAGKTVKLQVRTLFLLEQLQQQGKLQLQQLQQHAAVYAMQQKQLASCCCSSHKHETSSNCRSPSNDDQQLFICSSSKSRSGTLPARSASAP